MALSTVPVVLAVITTFLLHGGQCQSVTCFPGSSCSGSSFSSPDFKTCCLSTGYSYDSGGSCQNCTVIGWKNASMPDGSINTTISFELEERLLAHKFVVGCLKGNIQHATFNVLPADTEDLSTRPHLFAMLRCTDLIVDLFLLEDNRAMEPNEELTLSLDPIGMIDAIIINETKITIIDTDVVNLAFNEDDYSTTEGDGPLRLKVRQLNPIKTFDSNITLQLIPVDYNYVITNGIYSPGDFTYNPDTPNRAIGNLDYNSSPLTVTFPGNTRTLEVSADVNITDDLVDEVRQFFFVLLEVVNATNINRINLTTSIVQCNIDDNDDTYLSFEFSKYFFREISIGTGNYVIYVIKDRQSSTIETENKYEFTVQVKSTYQATDNVDFTESSGLQTISANEVRTPYLVQIIDDFEPEGNESFTLSISPVPNELQWINGRNVVTNVTIIDNDVLVIGFVQTVYSVSEGDGNVTVVVEIKQGTVGSGETVSLEFITQDITATDPSDYTSKIDFIFFTSGQSVDSQISITIPIVDEKIVEDVESFGASLSLLSNNLFLFVSPDEAKILIQDDDTPIIVGYEETIYTTIEGQGSVELFVVVTSPTTGTPCPFTLAASTSIGTAVEGSDYTPVMMKQLVFNIGDMRQSHNITILNDTVCERTPNERFFSNLTYISGDGPINITPMTAEIVINDFAEKECELIIGFLDTIYSVSEADGFVLVKVGILNGSVANESVTVYFFAQDDSAIGGTDYNVTVRNLTFIVDQRMGTIMNVQIPILRDNIAESIEFFLVGLSQVSVVTNVLVAPSQAMIFINDDDNLVVGFVDTAYFVSEEDGSATAILEIKQGTVGSGEVVTLEFTTRDNTAANSSDYTYITQFFSFTSGQTMGTQILITISIVNDSIAEGIESFFGSLFLQPTGLNVVVSPDQANIIITDNDANCTPQCQNEGTCIKDGICLCPPSWSGDRCQAAECFPECENGGNCTAPGVCQCLQGWSGIRCSTAECFPECENGGNCTAPGVCQCPQGWSGIRCSTAAVQEEKNSNSIIFLVIAIITITLLFVVITVLLAVFIYKRQQKQSEITMAQVAIPLNTIETLKVERIYENINACSEDEKDTSLQETINVKSQEPTKETEPLSPVMKGNGAYDAAATAGYGVGVVPFAVMKNAAYSLIGAGNIGEVGEYDVNPRVPSQLLADRTAGH